ncbi:hypothetical protein THERMOT_2008 [Bathymodiolus thermophilus thioautotrophic gill symbiont]|nr:hypothetical protein THERMOT_2008 [Bathymodiolus thermophilus thioautotrophic gill symbiont]
MKYFKFYITNSLGDEFQFIYEKVEVFAAQNEEEAINILSDDISHFSPSPPITAISV